LAVEELDTERKTVLFRVAQEAFVNISRHSGAKSAELRITRKKNAICMQIHDEGRGFDVAGVLRSNRGRRLGLLGMRERVEMSQGTLTIESSPATGTVLRVSFPFGERKTKRTGEIRSTAVT
jgi:signal transduction histidine kinase